MDLADLFTALPDDRSLRWHRLAAFIEGWWGALDPSDGVPEEELHAAEAHLGIALPAALREAYALFGQRDEIAASFATLVAPLRLRRREGMLIVWTHDERDEWGIREADLALSDPPMVLRSRTGGVWHDHPALPGEDSVSRFFLWKILDQATAGCRYENTVTVPGDLEPLAAEIGRRFTLLDFGLVEYPPPATRFYGGEDVLIAVRIDEGIKVTAPNLPAYRAALDALSDLSLDWEDPLDATAYKGEFHDQKQGHADMELLLRLAHKPAVQPPPSAPVPPPAAPSADRPASDDRATGAAGDLDPRVSLYITDALRPYTLLLPPTCVAHLRGALEVVVETDPLVGRCVNILLGRPITDDDVAPPVAPLPPAVEARVQAMTPENREGFLALVGSGLVDSMVGAFQRRFARMDADRNLPRETDEHEDFDYELTSDAESAMYRFMNHMPQPAVTDRAASGAELVRILRLLTASMFAGIAAELVTMARSGKTPSGGRYLRAMFAAQRVLAMRQDERLFSTYYVRREETDDAAKALGMPIAEEQERHRAFLDRVASAAEAMAEQLEQSGRGAYKAGEAFGDLMALLRRRESSGTE